MMTTAERWLDTTELGAHEPPVPPEDIRKVQADALRFAANWYVGAVCCNQAGIELNEIADALEAGRSIDSIVERAGMVPQPKTETPTLPTKSLLDIEP